ncbi:hypothetical protein OHA40_25705 [Nocardia sp. NBC_00508]|uniref:effector-associated constant component EACC1 n=1 Tax=Nocardia sp. NBC_00508 TaxID=2975992 RepID=UPI002E8178DA|nr:hypothetical protein [Nocardia sp. NBC_00508]WUD65030.1 hypothetical protein OHA40_25705 [Nocardia sp. NBC_00508]
MHARIDVEADGAAAELRSLWGRLVAEDELRQRVLSTEKAPERGTLGAVIDNLALVLAPSGLGVVAARVLVTWIRSRVGAVTLTVTAPDGRRYELESTNVRNLDAAAMQALMDSLAKAGDTESTAPE